MTGNSCKGAHDAHEYACPVFVQEDVKNVFNTGKGECWVGGIDDSVVGLVEVLVLETDNINDDPFNEFLNKSDAKEDVCERFDFFLADKECAIDILYRRERSRIFLADKECL